MRPASIRSSTEDKPLTYLAAQTETGYESTLQVRVSRRPLARSSDPLRDRAEGSDLYCAARRTYKTTVGFGDGKSGARTETGTENISAKYRIGSGLAGRVRAGQLSMLLPGHWA